MLQYIITREITLTSSLFRRLSFLPFPLPLFLLLLFFTLLNSPLSLSWYSCKYMSHEMTKPTKWVCAKQRLRSAWASSLIRFFTVHSMGSWGPKVSSCGQRRLWSDWADAQADLSLHWGHTHIVGFVMSRLTCIYTDTRKNPKCCVVRVLQMCMSIHPEGPDLWFFVWSFSWPPYCVSEQRRIWQDCTDVQACLCLCCSPMW